MANELHDTVTGQFAAKERETTDKKGTTRVKSKPAQYSPWLKELIRLGAAHQRLVTDREDDVKIAESKGQIMAHVQECE